MKNRELSTVLKEIIEVTTIEQLKTDLEKVIKDSIYRAPELISMSWNEAYSLLLENYFDKSEEFLIEEREEEGVKVFVIFSGNEETSIREQCIRQVHIYNVPYSYGVGVKFSYAVRATSTEEAKKKCQEELSNCKNFRPLIVYEPTLIE